MVAQPKADIDKVTEIVNYLLGEGSMSSYLEKNQDVRYIDLFMAVHSFHKLMVKNIAEKWAANHSGIKEEYIYREADVTFRNAMKELKRDLKPLALK